MIVSVTNWARLVAPLRTALKREAVTLRPKPERDRIGFLASWERTLAAQADLTIRALRD